MSGHRVDTIVDELLAALRSSTTVAVSCIEGPAAFTEHCDPKWSGR